VLFSAVSSIVVIVIAIFVSSVILLVGIICIKWYDSMDYSLATYRSVSLNIACWYCYF